MGPPRPALNPTTQSVGLTAKLVTVQSVSADGTQAVCVDRQNIQATVTLLVQRSKAPLPVAGETWLLTQDLGMWTFAAVVASSTGQFITPGAESGEVQAGAGQRVTIAANPPPGPSKGDIWVSGAAGNELFWWSGMAWVAAQFGTPALADGAVTAAKIASGAITSAQISPSAGITAGQVAFRASDIGGSRIVTGTAQPSSPVPGDLWINPSLGNQVSEWDGHTWTAVQFGAPAIQSASLGSAQMNFTAKDIGGITTSVGGIPPVGPAVGDLWFSEEQDFALLQWNGTAWVPYQFGTGAIAVGSITAELIAAGTITATQLAAGIVYAGIVDATEIDGAVLRSENSHGATIMTVNKSSGTWLLYADLGSSSQGGLVASGSQGRGTDEFGNPYKAGITAYDTAGTDYIQLLPGASAVISVGTGDAAELVPGVIESGTSGSGATRFLNMLMSAPKVRGEGSNDGAQLTLSSPTADLTTSQVQATLAATHSATTSAMTVTPAKVTISSPAVQVTGTSELDGTITLKNGSASSTISIASGDGHPQFSSALELAEIAAPSAPASGVKLYGSATGYFQAMPPEGNVYSTGPCVFQAAGGQPVNSLTPADVTGIAGITVAARTYHVRGVIICTQGATAANQAVQFKGPAVSLMNISTYFIENLSLFNSRVVTALASNMQTGSGFPGGTIGELYFDGLITFSASGSTFGLQALCVTSASDDWTIDAGSYLALTPA